MNVGVLLVEPDRSVRDAFATQLAEQDDIEVVATAEDASTTLLQTARTRAVVVLVSARFPGSLKALCEKLQASDHQPKVLLLDDVADEDALLDAIESGTDGYVSGFSDAAIVASAVRKVARGESAVPPSMLGPLLRRLIQRRRDADLAADKLDGLTRREREVLRLLVEGAGPKAIASTLVISPETARTHVQRILRKLEVHSQAEAVALVAQTGMADRLERLVARQVS